MPEEYFSFDSSCSRYICHFKKYNSFKFFCVCGKVNILGKQSKEEPERNGFAIRRTSKRITFK